MADRPTLEAERTGFSMSFAEEAPGGNLPAVPSAGETLIASQHAIITAQKVAVPRNHNRIMTQLRELCALMGQRYVYSWEVNDRRNRRKQEVTGLTIKAANDLARIYGNNIVDVRAVPDGRDHFMFYARYTDLETGYSMTRGFRQRVAQDLGMKDRDRAEDIVFQIGQSKAIRNVILNALQTYADEMLELAQRNMLGWVENNRQRADAWVNQALETHGIEVRRVEAYVGRKRAEWTVPQVARVMAVLRSVEEGMLGARDAFPSGDDVSIVEQEKAEKEAAGKQQDGAGDQQQGSGGDPPQTQQDEGQKAPGDQHQGKRTRKTAEKPAEQQGQPTSPPPSPPPPPVSPPPPPPPPPPSPPPSPPPPPAAEPVADDISGDWLGGGE
jgi:hypothetical protein